MGYHTELLSFAGVCAGISRTSWPCFRNTGLRQCASQQASKPISEVCTFAVYVSNCAV